jgi:hypothetical protein
MKAAPDRLGAEFEKWMNETSAARRLREDIVEHLLLREFIEVVSDDDIDVLMEIVDRVAERWHEDTK